MKGVETHSNLRAILCTSGLQQMRDSYIFFIFPILIYSIFKKRKTTGLYLQSKTYNIPVKIIETLVCSDTSHRQEHRKGWS